MSARPKRILVVDDEPNVRLMFHTALESPNREIALAADGESALERLGGASYDLVLLDLHMPFLDGMAVLRRLRAAGSDVPVMIMTAHDSTPDSAAAAALGVIDFLAKPLTPARLREAVDEVLARNEPTRPAAWVEAPGSVPVTPVARFAFHLNRAKRALNHRCPDEAEMFLREAVEIDPKSAEAHNLLGVVLECRNEHDDACREFRTALEADGFFQPAVRNLRLYGGRLAPASRGGPGDVRGRGEGRP